MLSAEAEGAQRRDGGIGICAPLQARSKPFILISANKLGPPIPASRRGPGTVPTSRRLIRGSHPVYSLIRGPLSKVPTKELGSGPYSALKTQVCSRGQGTNVRVIP